MKRLIQAVSKASDGAFVVDEDYRIVFWNRAAEAILGFSAEQAVGRRCYELLGGRDGKGRTVCQRFCRIALGTARGGSPPNLDLHASASGGEGRWINLSTFAYPLNGERSGNAIVHLFRDATRKMSAERFIEEISQASERLRDQHGDHNNLRFPPRSSADPKLSTLTAREQQVLRLLAGGLGTGEIAEALTISRSTTRNHIKNILGKLGVHSRLEAVAYAYQHGSVELSSGDE